jgi:hypothetical protein
MPLRMLNPLKWKVLYALGHAEARLRAEIEASGYFNAEWYLSHYPELLNDPVVVRDPLGHFIAHGVRERRNPGPGFHTAWYLDEYEDVQASGINPLVHYLRHGRREERWPTPYLGGMRERIPFLNGHGHHRVIYRSRRSGDLSHLGRVKRLEADVGVGVWRAFSQAFRKGGHDLPREDAEYLHNRGFLPSRKRLYRLPSYGVDAYLSDLQVELLPLTNGAAQQLLETPSLQAQLFRSRLSNGIAAEQEGIVRRLKVLLIMQPATGQLVPLAAVVFREASAASAGMALSMNLSPRSGRVTSVARYHPEGRVLGPRRPLPWERHRYRAAWQRCKRSILPVIHESTPFSFAQVDIDISSAQPRLIRLYSKPCIEAFQVHGPLMNSETAIDFLREFGL